MSEFFYAFCSRLFDESGLMRWRKERCWWDYPEKIVSWCRSLRSLMIISEFRETFFALKLQKVSKERREKIQFNFLYTLNFWNFNIISLIKLKRFCFSDLLARSRSFHSIFRQLFFSGLFSSLNCVQFLIITKIQKMKIVCLLRLQNIITLMSLKFCVEISLSSFRCIQGVRIFWVVRLLQNIKIEWCTVKN